MHPDPLAEPAPILNLSGVMPHLAVRAAHHPARSETGIGALMPWADRLWFVTYVAHKGHTGAGTGLFFIDDAMRLHRHAASVVGTYANRMIHAESSQLFIGPHVIDTEGRVRTIEALVDTRLTAVCRHLEAPAEKVYLLGMEGEFVEVDVRTLKVTPLADLKEELGIHRKGPPHFKDAFTNHGRVVVANNSYYAADFDHPEDGNGRLAEWNGKQWTVIERTQFNTVTGRVEPRGRLGRATFAVGQDRASAILKVFLPEAGWQTYRMPKGTHTQDHAYTTEWPRIREVESERWLMNASGLFYEMAAMTYANRVWGVKPVCSHLRIVGDFCAWKGLLVMAGDQTTPIGNQNPWAGQPQANLWMGKTDDLWRWGKPAGWGGPWWDTPVQAGIPSDPFLMTSFEHKCLHLSHDADGPARFDVEVDFHGTGRFHRVVSLQAEDGYACHVFPTGFSAHWVRLVADRDTVASAQFHYT